MGVDKALVVVEGEPMVMRVAHALTDAGADEVSIVGGDAEAFGSLGLGPVADRWPGAGPLGGLVTALDVASAAVVVVLAADLLGPDPAAIRGVVEALAAAASADLAVPVVDGRAQWLHAAWRRSCRARLEHEFAAGQRAIHRAVAGAGLGVVEVAGLTATTVADADAPDQLPPR
jgi:molybdopterin-guanine dinucleotide biosynthesis protein A